MKEIKLPSAGQFDEIIRQMKIANRDMGQDDFTGSPGSKSLIAGDLDAGFYGFVQPQEFGKIGDKDFNGVNLASEVGISQGASQFSNTPWLKFSWNRKVLFTPLKAIRRSISWDHIYQAGAVYGTGSTISDGEQNMLETDHYYTEDDRVSQNAKVTINGIEYKVRLFRGAGSDPIDYSSSDRGSNGKENEWNGLILPLHEHAPSSFNYNQYADTPRPDWNIGLTDEILHAHNRYGTGSYSWCQETNDAPLSDDNGEIRRRVFRGHYGASTLSAVHSSHTGTALGWRPVLELL